MGYAWGADARHRQLGCKAHYPCAMHSSMLHFMIRSNDPEPDHTNAFKAVAEQVSFTFESFDNCKARDLMHHGAMNSNFTGSSEVLDLLKRCLCRCLEDHEECRRRKAQSSSRLGSYLPPRLIKIDGSYIRIVDTDQQPLHSAHSANLYTTLSYCWGRQPRHLTLTSLNFDRLRQGIPLQSLPATFRDAITLTSHLNVDYLWIDSLCILQEGPGSDTDWRKHVQEMHKIYTNGLINIAAEHGENADSGCFVYRDVTTAKPCLIDLSGVGLHRSQINFANPGSSNIISIIPYQNWGSRSPRSYKRPPLRERGWVLQERLLAPRVVTFTRNSISWQCDTEHRTETRLQTTFEKQKLERDFYALVAEYSALHLTKAHDKLPAIAALAQNACERSASGYVAGLLTARLAEGLTWRRRGQPLRRHGFAWRAPSWSWASCDGEVSFPFSASTLVCEVPEIGVKLLDPAYPFGQIGSASMIIIAMVLELTEPAPVVPSTIDRSIHYPVAAVFSAACCESMSYRSREAVLLAIDDSELDCDLGGSILAIIACEYRPLNYIGLILAPASLAGSVMESPTEWRRIGWFETPRTIRTEEQETANMPEKMTLKIV